MTDDLPPLREVIREHGLGANKAFGQNYLLDLNLTRRIARTAGDLSECDVIEVGPGPGGLTRALLMEGARRVIVIEKDRRFIPALEQISNAYPDRLTIIREDALTAANADLVTGPARIVANLPYNIGTQLLVNWLQGGRSGHWWQSLTLLFQKEVARRIVALPGEPDYGRLSVLSAVCCKARIAFDISPKAFTPPPKVTSSLIHAIPAENVDFPMLSALEDVTRAAFGQRRKMLRSSLRTVFDDAEAVLNMVGIDPTRRAETVTIEEFEALARVRQRHLG